MKDVSDLVNTGHEDACFKIGVVEKKYNAKYVGQLCLKTKDGMWVNNAADIFWQPNPPVEGYSNYFALIIQGGVPYITSGASAVEGIITGVVARDGEIIYSRYRHDYRLSQDQTAWIDGGRDYSRYEAGSTCVSLKIVDGRFFQLEDGEE